VEEVVVGREVPGARREAREVRVAVEVRLLGMFHPLRGLGVRVAIRVREDLQELEVVLRRPRLEKLVLLGPVFGRGDWQEEVLPRCRASVAVLRWASAASSAAFVDLIEAVKSVVEATHLIMVHVMVLALQSLTNILLVHLSKAPRLRIREVGQRQDLASHRTTEEDDIMVVEQLLLTNPVPGHL
jgi:hypothetical protein